MTFAGKTGLSEMPPQMPLWDKWARSLRVDLSAECAYAQAMYQSTDDYLASLTDEDLHRPFDLLFTINHPCASP
jgi:hypothetical protein